MHYKDLKQTFILILFTSPTLGKKSPVRFLLKVEKCLLMMRQQTFFLANQNDSSLFLLFLPMLVLGLFHFGPI